MKKIIYTTIITLLFASVIPHTTKADIPPPAGSHTVEICNTISNLGDFPNIVVVERSSGPESDPKKGTLVENGKCFGAGAYKFSTLDIVYWTTTQFKLINIKNLEANHSTPLAFNVPFVGDVVQDSTHLVKQDIQYSIGTSADGTLSLYKSNITSEYNDGRPNQTQTIANPTNAKKIIPVIDDSTATQTITVNDTSFPTPQPMTPPPHKSIWQKILCFFGIGNNC